MKTLKIEYLSPYLPYGLNVLRPDGRTILRVFGITEDRIIFSEPDKNDWTYGHLSIAKPILRPLSDLTKEIEHNGEKFIFSDVYLGNKKIKQIIGEEYSTFNNFLNDVDYSSIQLLFKYHFDVFGLIDENLAIDINTLKS